MTKEKKEKKEDDEHEKSEKHDDNGNEGSHKDHEEAQNKKNDDNTHSDKHTDDTDDLGDDSKYEDVYVSFNFPSSRTQLEQTVENKVKPSTTTEAGTELEDLKSNMDSSAPSSAKNIRISGLSRQKPLVQIHNNVYRGEWSKLVGTELVFNENGDFVTKVDSHLVLNSGKLESHKVATEPFLKRALQLARDVKKDTKPDKAEKQKEDTDGDVIMD